MNPLINVFLLVIFLLCLIVYLIYLCVHLALPVVPAPLLSISLSPSLLRWQFHEQGVTPIK